MTASVDRPSVRLIGLDAASQRSKFGYALGHFDPESGRVTVDRAGLLDDGNDVLRNQIVPFICGGERALIAIDAPLGWPDGLKQLLQGHEAGMPPPAGLAKDASFRRHTENQVRKVKIPLEVAADRIARAAFEALCVLNELRSESKQPLPLAWSPDFTGAASIEVYPGATLAVRKLARPKYKQTDQTSGREQIAMSLVHEGLVGTLPTEPLRRALQDADILDAILCMVAARDFLMGECEPPDMAHIDQARREGWIWVLRGDHERT